MQDDLLNKLDGESGKTGLQATRRLDPETVANWSVPIGAVIVAMAFLAGGWAATSGKPALRSRQITAPVSPTVLPPQPSYAAAPPPPPIIYSRQPDSNVGITPAPMERQIARASAPSGSSSSAARGSFAPPASSTGSPPGQSGGFNLPSYRGPSGDLSPQLPADEETVRLARARAEVIRDEQARMDLEQAQRIAALDAARRSAARDSQIRQRSRLDPGLLSPPGRDSNEAKHRRDSFLGDTDFRDEQTTWGRH